MTAGLAYARRLTAPRGYLAMVRCWDQSSSGTSWAWENLAMYARSSLEKDPTRNDGTECRLVPMHSSKQVPEFQNSNLTILQSGICLHFGRLLNALNMSIRFKRRPAAAEGFRNRVQKRQQDGRIVAQAQKMLEKMAVHASVPRTPFSILILEAVPEAL